MIEKFMLSIVQELGAVGVLLLGLTLVFFHAAREISAPLKVINKEIGEIRDLLKEMVLKLK